MPATMIASPGVSSRGATRVGARWALGEAFDGARQTVADRARLTTLRQDCGTFTISGGRQGQPCGDGYYVEFHVRVQPVDLLDRGPVEGVRR